MYSLNEINGKHFYEFKGANVISGNRPLAFILFSQCRPLGDTPVDISFGI